LDRNGRRGGRPRFLVVKVKSFQHRNLVIVRNKMSLLCPSRIDLKELKPPPAQGS
jgi:hypothetical protein